jgi:hypothetical protein
MHEIQVSVASAEAADFGVAELSVAGELIGHTILEDGDLMRGPELGRIQMLRLPPADTVRS